MSIGTAYRSNDECSKLATETWDSQPAETKGLVFSDISPLFKLAGSMSGVEMSGAGRDALIPVRVIQDHYDSSHWEMKVAIRVRVARGSKLVEDGRFEDGRYVASE